MKALKTKDFRMINIVAMSIIGIIVLFILFSDTGKQVSINNKKASNLKKTIDSLSQSRKTSKDINEQRDIIARELNVIDEKIPKEMQVPQVIDQITKPLEELRLSLVEINTKEQIERRNVLENKRLENMESFEMGQETMMNKEERVVKEECYVETLIELSLTGNYKEFGKYLNTLRSIHRLVTIKEFSLRKQEKDKDAKSLGIKLIISAYNYGKK